jgi:RNA polymerase sigma-70 factor (ECF subfamily)
MSDTDCLIINPMEEQDGALVRAVTGRDPRLLNELIERYQYRLYRYLLCLVRNRETAGDLFQETWLRVLERGHQYKPRFRFEAWLFTIARNLVFDLMRRRKTVNPEPLEDSGDELSARGIAARESPSPLDSLASLEEGQRVHNALDRLPALVREALLLRYQEDLALEEIARIVSAPVPTVKSRIYRGLDTLRSQLEKE